MSEVIVRVVSINEQISGELVAELVRCKDCKHRETIYCPFYQKYKGTKYDDWFCADGKKKSTIKVAEQ